MNNFTPGPWKLQSIFTDEDGYKIGKDGRALLIAAVKNQGSAPVDEAKANANLIAAAPEMYEALKSSAAAMRKYGVLGRQLEQIDAALAKADGRPA